MPRAVDFPLYLITDRQQTGAHALADVVEAALKGGVRAVQLREKDLPARELYEMALELRSLTRRYAAALIINDRVDLALAVDADGVHLGSGSLPICSVRPLIGQHRLIGVSCHCPQEVSNAQKNGADFVTFGPVYPTPSKAMYGEPVGLDLLGAVAAANTIPVFALGGIKQQQVPEVLAHGAFGIALISAIIAAHDPEHEARTLLSLIAQERRPNP